MPWNKITLDTKSIADRFVAGETKPSIGASYGVTEIVIDRHLKEFLGDRYADALKTHWHVLAAGRVLRRAGNKAKGGARWFTAEEEAHIVADFRAKPDTLEGFARKHGCSRVVMKRLLARNIPKEERKPLLDSTRKGKRLVEYVPKTCPACGKEFGVVPWKDRQGLTYCSKRCKGIATRGANSHLYGKTNHAIGRWYTLNGRRIWMRSSWEYGVALYLDFIGEKWEYEPKTFLIEVDGKPTSYTPDFFMTSRNKFIEVKGYWRAEYVKKYVAFKEAFRSVRLVVWDRPVLLEHQIINRKNVVIMPELRS